MGLPIWVEIFLLESKLVFKAKKASLYLGAFLIKNLGAGPQGMSRWLGRKILLKIRDIPIAIGTGNLPSWSGGLNPQ
jgi:hypothetical protein